MSVVMGTAGHIDHGKTMLIEALTGTNCDRLEEEKRRGITISLGFAQLKLSDGRNLSIVDVPGHEKFVRTMVSGAAGVDLILLVIAADEGVMPQTREHLEICSLLGIRAVVVAMTKIDAVDEEMRALAADDIATFLARNGHEDAPVIPVSSRTGEGIDALRQTLEKLSATLSSVHGQGLFRLPVDRVFTMKGRGTVVTGTIIAGSVSVGDTVMLYPGETESKVRGLQCHGEDIRTAQAGRRLAVNLPNLAVEDINKGDVISYPNGLFPSTRWIIALTCLPSSPRALRHRMECHFHHGAREMQARLFFADREKLQPGETCVCEVRFIDPEVAVFGDRCVLRSFSPLRTVAGGVVLNPCGVDMRRRNSGFSERCRLLAALNPDGAEQVTPEHRVLNQLLCTQNAEYGLSFEQLRVLANLDASSLEKILGILASKKQVACFDKTARLYITGQELTTLTASCKSAVANFHKRHSALKGISRSELCSDWGKALAPRLAQYTVECLLKQGVLVADNELLRLPGHQAAFSAEDAPLSRDLLKVYKESGLMPPNTDMVLQKLGVDKKQVAPIYKALRAGGQLVRVNEDIWYAAEHLRTIETTIQRWFDEHETMHIQDVKTLLGISRKYIVPLLDYFDAQNLTMRVGDTRMPRKK